MFIEKQTCADALANIGCSLDHNVIFYDTCPDIISDIMLVDLMGITTPRMIVVKFFLGFSPQLYQKNVDFCLKLRPEGVDSSH
jgi:hypothetical protein